MGGGAVSKVWARSGDEIEYGLGEPVQRLRPEWVGRRDMVGIVQPAISPLQSSGAVRANSRPTDDVIRLSEIETDLFTREAVANSGRKVIAVTAVISVVA